MLAAKIILYLALSREICHSAYFDFRAVITKLLDTYDFDTFVYLIPDQAELDKSSILQNSSFKEVPALIVSRPLSINISHIINGNILSFVFMNNRTKDSVLSLLSSVLYKYRHSNHQSRIIFFATDLLAPNDILDLFKECWKFRMINVVLIMDHQFFTYNPYPTDVQIIVLDSNSRPSDWFSDKNKNLRGYNLRYPMQPDIPRTMTYIDRKGRRKFGGYFIKIVLSFLEKYNAILQECDRTKNLRTLKDLFTNLNGGNIDLLAYGIHRAATDALPYTHTYPIAMDQMCIVTPYQHELPRYFYFLLPFDVSVWKLIGYSVLLFVFCQACISRLSSGSTSSLNNLIFQSFRIIVCQPHFEASLAQRKAYILSFILMLFLAAILESVYTSLLTSFFTKAIMSNQISTYDDIVRSGIKIMLKGGLYDDNEQFNYFPTKYYSSFVRGHVTDVEENVLQMNTNLGYYLTEDFINIIYWAQKAASYKYFYMTKLCYERVFLMIPLEKDSPLRTGFDDLILRCWSAGLIEKWKSDFVYESIEAGLLRIEIKSESVLLKLKWKDLRYGWYAYLFGICISIVTFILEYLMILPKIKYFLKKYLDIVS